MFAMFYYIFVIKILESYYFFYLLFITCGESAIY